MAKYSIEEQTLDNIANAILAKTGSSTALTPEQMPTAIAGIETGESATPPYSEYTINDQYRVTHARMIGYSAIPESNFRNYNFLEEVDVSNSTIERIGDYAFYGCSIFQIDSLPDTLTYLGLYAFYSCGDLDLPTLPSNVTEISNNTFAYCSQLKLTTIPDQIVTIRDNAFVSCKSLSWTRLPSSLTSIGQYSFFKCTALSITQLPETIVKVTKYAFSGCTGLTNLEIGAIDIGEYAFQDCTGLQKVWIRNSCTTITASASSKSPFVGCSSSLEIYVEASEAPSGWDAYFNRTSTSGNVTATVVYDQTTCPW